MICITLKHAIFKRQLSLGQEITIKEIAEATGVSRATLHRMIKDPTYNACLAHLGKICDYLQCEASDLLRANKTSKK
jgi:putative transcriptional regulator